jgi:hypothetical protein
MGWIFQRCKKCQWEADKLDIEYQACPTCGEPVFDEAILKFGGLTVKYDSIGNRFYLKTPHTDSIVEVDTADCIDTTAFLLKHFKSGK